MVEPISPELALIDPQLANHFPRKAGTMIAPFDSESAPVPGANGSPSAAADPPSVEGLLFAAGAISADQLGEVVRDAVLSDRPVAAVAVERGFVTRDALAELLRTSGAHVSVAEALGEPEVVPPAIEATPMTVSIPVEEGAAGAFVPVVHPLDAAPQAVATIPAQVPLPAMSAVQQAVAAAANGVAPAGPAAFAAVAVEPLLEIVPEPTVQEPALAVAPPAGPLFEVPLPAEAEAQQAPAVSAAFVVSVRLESGERVAVVTAESLEHATELGRGLVETLSASGEWPFVAGRFIRPAAIVSIDIERALGD
jgi:hypothetical protein